MNKTWIFVFCAMFAATACTYERKGGGVINREGFNFTYTSTSTEDALDDSTQNIEYTVTFPDGSKATTFDDYSPRSARREMEKLIDNWLVRNVRRDDAPTKPAETAKTTTSGPSQSETFGD